MTEDAETYLEQLSQKIDQLLAVIAELQDTNGRLSEELKKHQAGYYNQDYLRQIANLEENIRLLKKEKRTLKEREKLIKNKVERLAVKLDKIEG